MRRLVPVAIAALAVTLSACGASSGTTAPNQKDAGATNLIAASADQTAAAKSARMSGEVTVEVQGETKTLPLDGAVDFESGAFEFGYDLGQLGLPGAGDAKIQARMVDGVMYMSLGDLAGDGGGILGSVLGGKSWVKIDLKALGADAAGASGGLSAADPGGTLEALRGAGDVTTIGTESLRGVETTHYRATIDPKKALDEAPAGLRERAAAGLERLGGPIPVDVWIDGDGQARKIAMTIDAEHTKVSTSIEYYDFGTKIDVTAPPADDVFDFSDMLGGMRRRLSPTNDAT